MIGKCQISVLDKHAIHALARGQTRAEFSTVRGAGVCGVWLSLALAWLVGGGLVKCGGSEGRKPPHRAGQGTGGRVVQMSGMCSVACVRVLDEQLCTWRQRMGGGGLDVDVE